MGTRRGISEGIRWEILLAKAEAGKSLEAYEPIVLTVPHDNVTERVCQHLGLDTPDHCADVLGNEGLAQIVFDGEESQDEGGVRRAWFECAANHFIKSDMFHAPDEDAAHLCSSGTLIDSFASG